MKRMMMLFLVVFLIGCESTPKEALNEQEMRVKTLEKELEILNEEMEKLEKEEANLDQEIKNAQKEKTSINTHTEKTEHEDEAETDHIAETNAQDEFNEIFPTFLAIKDNFLEIVFPAYMMQAVLYDAEWQMNVEEHIGYVRDCLEQIDALPNSNDDTDYIGVLKDVSTTYNENLDQIEQAISLAVAEEYESSADLFYRAIDELKYAEEQLSTNFGLTNMFDQMLH
ncbi:MAG TPA: hypothetical protein H9895_06715 [Candidatus Pseudogracilibacillus intestinigallinarum]|uniref:Uncharacterized protein n=1 Tax=Candidatus Pseudogracilibacillus intestinigallinarum TaxID=2838742 RepID=A0A9D1PMG4_9BACI|nr:hypothetical protein [Candidatus Pseudogracilibacillus intestinigallinarum]